MDTESRIRFKTVSDLFRKEKKEIVRDEMRRFSNRSPLTSDGFLLFFLFLESR
ncbi:hypothetical protein LEP1GSC052_2674 [Leptospira kmetyi serovar Malaysia str. Bejo-Iso9]|nr:hypothetical protein LEP1GSC052_2674 [Leptospira kmetyi serovar Malaysia str. Bejo-Iso9]